MAEMACRKGSEDRLEDSEPDKQSGDEDDTDNPANDLEHVKNLPVFWL